MQIYMQISYLRKEFKEFKTLKAQERGLGSYSCNIVCQLVFECDLFHIWICIVLQLNTGICIVIHLSLEFAWCQSFLESDLDSITHTTPRASVLQYYVCLWRNGAEMLKCWFACWVTSRLTHVSGWSWYEADFWRVWTDRQEHPLPSMCPHLSTTVYWIKCVDNHWTASVVYCPDVV